MAANPNIGPASPSPPICRYGATPGPRIVPSPNALVRAASAPVRSNALVRAATYACAAGFDAEPKMPNRLRSAAKVTNTAVGPSSPRRPARIAAAQPNIDTAKPAQPISIRRLRPRVSDLRAQYGADTVHSSADSEKMTATSVGRMPITRAIDGSTDCSAVLPAATTSRTANSTAKSRRGTALMRAGVADAARFANPARQAMAKAHEEITR